MKKASSLALDVILILAFTISDSLADNASEKTIQLTYSHFFPPTHFNGQLGDSWAKEIEKRTHGLVKITYDPGGSLLKGPAR